MARPRSEYINKEDIDHLLGILFDEARRDPKVKVKIEKILNQSQLSTSAKAYYFKQLEDQ